MVSTFGDVLRKAFLIPLLYNYSLVICYFYDWGFYTHRVKGHTYELRAPVPQQVGGSSPGCFSWRWGGTGRNCPMRGQWVDGYCGSQISSFLWSEWKSATQTGGQKLSCALEVRWVSLWTREERTFCFRHLQQTGGAHSPGVSCICSVIGKEVWPGEEGSIEEGDLMRDERAFGYDPGLLGMECGWEGLAARG